MSDNNRERNSGTVNISSSDNDINTVVKLRDGEYLSVGYLRVDYADSATNEATVTIYDESDGTAPANATRVIDSMLVNSSDNIIIESPVYKTVERDVLVQVSGQDGELNVTVGGESVTG